LQLNLLNERDKRNWVLITIINTFVATWMPRYYSAGAEQK